MVCNLIVIATALTREGWYPESQEGVSTVNSSLAEPVKGTTLFANHDAVPMQHIAD
jgi:hypothetical protein